MGSTKIIIGNPDIKAHSLHERFPFIENDIFLGVYIDLEFNHRYIIFRKINPQTQEIEVANQLYISRETLGFDTRLSAEDYFLVLKNYIQSIAIQGINAFRKLTSTCLASFLLESLIYCDVKYAIQYLDQLEDDNRLGGISRDNFRAGLEIILTVIARVLKTYDMINTLTPIVIRIAELDSDIVFDFVKNPRTTDPYRTLIATHSEFSLYPQYHYQDLNQEYPWKPDYQELKENQTEKTVRYRGRRYVYWVEDNGRRKEHCWGKNSEEQMELPIVEEEYAIIRELEALTGQFPLSAHIGFDSFGVWISDTHVVELGLSGWEDHWCLSSLPESIWKLTSLKVLALGKNQLTSLSERIGGMSKLEKLYLHENQFFSLPESIGQLSNLTVLDISENPLPAVPSYLGQLTTLKELYLNDLRLTKLPISVWQLSALKVLSLSKNFLASIPEKFDSLKNLEHLDLSKNLITSLPATLVTLEKLSHLNIEDNRLPSITDSIGDLSSLKTLNLGRNRLLTLPNGMGKLLHLHQLYLNENRLKSLPESIGNLSQLQELYLSKNFLTELPDSIGNLSNLSILHLEFNDLSALPASIENLDHLTKTDKNIIKHPFQNEFYIKFNPLDRLSERSPQFLKDNYFQDLIPGEDISERYQFIRDDVFLIAHIQQPFKRQCLEFQKIDPTTKKVEFSDKFECIHPVSTLLEYDSYMVYLERKKEDPTYDHNRDEYNVAALRKDLDTDYRLEGDYYDVFDYEVFDLFFAFKSWTHAIADSGLEALQLQGQLDEIIEVGHPISQFLGKNLIRVDSSFLMQFLNKVKNECVFEGVYHRPSLRANLMILLRAISDMDLFGDGHRGLVSMDDRMTNDVIECLRAIAKLDKEFLIGNKDHFLRVQGNEDRIGRFLELHKII